MCLLTIFRSPTREHWGACVREKNITIECFSNIVYYTTQTHDTSRQDWQLSFIFFFRSCCIVIARLMLHIENEMSHLENKSIEFLYDTRLRIWNIIIIMIIIITDLELQKHRNEILIRLVWFKRVLTISYIESDDFLSGPLLCSFIKKKDH